MAFDVAKMCRQSTREECDLQRIFYRSTSNEVVNKFRLQTITYGTKATSFLSTWCLVKIAKDCFDEFIK